MAVDTAGAEPMEIGTSHIGGHVVLIPKRALTVETCEQMENTVARFIEQHKTAFVIDLKSVPLVDSRGLESLLRLNEEIREMGGVLKIINVNALCRDILLCTRLANVFNVYQDLHAAIKSKP